MNLEVYDRLNPPAFKCPSMMSTFIVLQTCAPHLHEDGEEELALLTDLRIEGMVLEGEWGKC